MMPCSRALGGGIQDLRRGRPLVHLGEHLVGAGLPRRRTPSSARPRDSARQVSSEKRPERVDARLAPPAQAERLDARCHFASVGSR